VIDFILLFIVLVFGSVLTRKVCSVGQFGPLLFALSRIKLTKLRLLVEREKGVSQHILTDWK